MAKKQVYSPSCLEVVVAKTSRASCRICTRRILAGEKKALYADNSFAFGHSSEKSLCKACTLNYLATVAVALEDEEAPTLPQTRRYKALGENK